jgi:hypothetical protein
LGEIWGHWCNLITNIDEFIACPDNCILSGSDLLLSNFARIYLGYNSDKGIDFVAKFNDKLVIGETKFLTDFGGHQNAQFNDAIALLKSSLIARTNYKEIVKIAIIDGVLYIKSNTKMYNYLIESNEIIISALLLREFLYSL